MDISYNCALGHNPPLPANPDANRLQLHQPPTVKKYLKTYKAEGTKHALPARQFNLEQSTSVGVPLSPVQQTEAVEIDALKTKAMLWVHRKCRKVYLGKVSFSEAVDVPKRLLIFWQTAVRRIHSGFPTVASACHHLTPNGQCTVVSIGLVPVLVNH